MELRRGLLTLCLLCIIPTTTAEPLVSVAISSVLRGGETQKACLTTKHTSNMDVYVTLEMFEKNLTMIDAQVPPGDISKTYEIQVPEVNKTTPVFLVVSAVSGNYNYKTRRTVAIIPTGKVVFIRTEKQVYKASQNVNIYILSVDNNLRPVDETFPLIYVMDKSGNRMHQWLNQKTQGNYLHISFRIIDDPEFGNYNIVAERESGTSVTKTIKVEHYDLPKYIITLITPKSVTTVDKSIDFEVICRYTYDQGVPGKITAKLCRPPSNYYVGNACNKNPDGICMTITGETDSEGTYKGSVDLSTFQLNRSGFNMGFIMQVTMTEQGTNVQHTETKIISLTNQLGRAYFDRKVMLQYFKKNLPFPVAIIVENGLGQPQSGQVVELRVNQKNVANLTSDEKGKAECEVDTSEFITSSVSFELTYKTEEQCYDDNWIVPFYSNDFHTVSGFFSRTESFVQLQGPREEVQCGTKQNIKVQYTFGKNALPSGETTIKFVYMIISRAQIRESGEHSVDVSKSLQGEFNLNYEASSKHVPILQYAVYCMLKEEVVGDVIELNLEKCFNNQVLSSFSLEMGTPGSNVDLKVNATPESACLANVFDSSLLSLGEEQLFSSDLVFSSLPYNKLNGFWFEGFNLASPEPPCTDVTKRVLVNGMYHIPITYSEEGDVSEIFSNVGMHLITPTPSRQPQTCSQPFPGRFHAEFDIIDTPFHTSPPPPPAFNRENVGVPVITTFRSWFPETMFIGVTYVGSSGSTSVPLKVPGTITKWKGDVICLSKETGLGINKYPANFTSFQKMFVDLSLPDSIVRGEMMHVVGTVVNYMEKCAKVQVTLQTSGDYAAEAADESPVKCVCSHKRISFSWKINPTTIGESKVTLTAETIHIGETCEGSADPNEPNRKDTIERSIKVEAEGVREEVTKTDFVCVKDSESIITVSINPSGNIVPNSMRAKFQVIGEILGRAVDKPENLIVEPTGCGEQNLAKLISVLRALEYLELVGRLTEEFRQRALQYLAIGYVKQLQYRHFDGSFSAFGQGRSEPSSWLTAMTLNNFWDMRTRTFVDERIMQQGMLSLQRSQEISTGRFKPSGTVFNTGLKGGADDDIGFTCYVVAFLSKTTYAASYAMIERALSYLDSASRKDQSVYNYALLFYVFRKSKKVERANAMREKLLSLAIDKGFSLHWERRVKPTQKPSYLFSPRMPAAEMEITAYALMGWVYGEKSSTVSKENLNIMAKISIGLLQEQNIHGSYITSSDTMIVLEALCAYGALVYQKDATNTVQLKNEEVVIKTFIIDQPSRILLQSEVLPQVPGNYSMVVSGNGCVLLQTGVEFNVPPKLENAAFLLLLITFPENCKDGVADIITIQVNASYHGIREKSNMALVDIPLFSGYYLLEDSLSKLQSQFSKVEITNNHVIIYIDEVTREDVSFTVAQKIGPRVDTWQQRTIKIYDYYEIDEHAFIVVNHPCTKSN